MRTFLIAYALLVMIVLSPILLHGAARTIELVSSNNNQPITVRTTTFLQVGGKRVVLKIPILVSVIALAAALALVALVLALPLLVSEAEM